MEKPEYGDLYKFIASVGVVLISLAIVMPWLMLRESFDVFHTAKEISEMTSTAQAVIEYRQNTALWWVQNVGYFSAALATVGLGTLGIGVYFWRTKQRTADKKEDLELKKLERDLEPMKPEEIADKKIKEVEEQVASEALPTNGSSTEPAELKELTPSYMRIAVSRTFEIERAIANRIVDCFRDVAVIETNKKISSVDFDIILAWSRSSRKDVIFNIRLMGRNAIAKNIRNIVGQTLSSIEAYSTVIKRPVGAVIIFVLPNSPVPTSHPRSVQEFLDIYKHKLSVFYITEEEAENLSFDKLKEMVESIQYPQQHTIDFDN